MRPPRDHHQLAPGAPKQSHGSVFTIDGGYAFPEARTRSEQALLSVVMEAYINGVSTRKVERLVEQLGLQGIS